MRCAHCGHDAEIANANLREAVFLAVTKAYVAAAQWLESKGLYLEANEMRTRAAVVGKEIG